MRDKNRVLLITPPYHCGVVEVAGSWMPLTLAYLAGEVRKAEFHVRIFDAMTRFVGFKEIREACLDFKPDYVGVTAITATAPDAIETARTAKETLHGVTTILGGVHPTFMDQEILETSQGAVDYILRGEGEQSFPRLLRELAQGGEALSVPGLSTLADGQICRGPDPVRPQDLDLFEPAFDLLDWEIYTYYVMPGSRLAAVSTSRGCDQACTFCSQQKFTDKTWRARDPDQCAQEIARLEKDFGVSVVLITDELPTKDPDRWERFLKAKIRYAPEVKLLMETRVSDIMRDRLILPLYRKAGIIHVYVGAEAGDQETLDLLKKDMPVEDSARAIGLIKENGMITETSLILGLPDETPDSVKKTLAKAREFNPDFAHFLALAPWPYADIYPEMEPFIVEKDYRKYNLVDPVIQPRAMSRSEIDKAIVDCYRQFYTGKLGELMAMKDPFRKEYLLRSMRLIMNSSFITSKLGVLGTLPKVVEKVLKALNL